MAAGDLCHRPLLIGKLSGTVDGDPSVMVLGEVDIRVELVLRFHVPVCLAIERRLPEFRIRREVRGRVNAEEPTRISQQVERADDRMAVDCCDDIRESTLKIRAVRGRGLKTGNLQTRIEFVPSQVGAIEKSRKLLQTKWEKFTDRPKRMEVGQESI